MFSDPGIYSKLPAVNSNMGPVSAMSVSQQYVLQREICHELRNRKTKICPSRRQLSLPLFLYVVKSCLYNLQSQNFSNLRGAGSISGIDNTTVGYFVATLGRAAFPLTVGLNWKSDGLVSHYGSYLRNLIGRTVW